MEKQTVKKIMKGVMATIFVLFFLQAIIPSPLLAANELNWDNPNKNGNNPYRFRLQDSLNSELIMQVVGCTGVVDKVSTAMMSVASETANDAIKKFKLRAAIKACEAAKGSAGTAVATVMNTELTTAVGLNVNCEPIVNTEDAETSKETAKIAKEIEKSRNFTECLSGIGVTLARNQLTAMTRYTMNWINTGFNGNPMYVQNITSLTNSIERNILEKGISQLGNTNKAYPYGSSFSSSMIRGYNAGARKYGATNFLDSLTSDLAYFITDKDSYYSSEPDNRTALERAQHANNTFANDFSTGGWNGWLALTQRDQNNPLGFTMQASQYLADRIAEQSQEKKDELYQNNGFLSQKKCVLWELYDEENAAVYDQYDNIKTATSKPSNYPNSICIKDEIVTPGSIIQDKISYYVNSPERQLELADSINDSLNSLFSALISKLQNQGLSSISSEKYTYTLNGVEDKNMGISSGYTNDFEGGSFSNSSGYRNGSFDLTRDLGNTYIYNYESESLGDWDAKNNNPKLFIGFGPTKEIEGEIKYLNNVYYTVITAGNTKLFNEGYSGWSVGDRAFWDGKTWQNWKKDIIRDDKTIKTNPIEKRGVIQIQKDYIVAAKNIISKLPNIMPKIGELDYCIPGPNPNWESNSSQAYSAFSEYAFSLNARWYDKDSWLGRDRSEYTIAGPGDKIYETYKNIFKGTTPTWWAKITSSKIWQDLHIVMGGKNFSTEKENDEEEKNLGTIEAAKNHAAVGLEKFVSEYKKAMDALYGKKSLMQTPYFEKENTFSQTENESFLGVSQEALNITKDIMLYDEDINQSIQDYKDAITETEFNINKLDKIKNRVSEIIKIAQDRRDENLVKILNEETLRECNNNYIKCMSTGFGLTPQEIARIGERGQLCSAKKQICESKTITEAEYKTKYASCLAEEDILYYNDNDIMNSGGEERCYDGIDNDLDGLVDAQDTDCIGAGNGNNGGNTGNSNNGICADGTSFTSPNPYDIPGSGATCNYYTSQSSCLGSSYTRNKLEGGELVTVTYNCQWFTLN